MTQKPDQSNHPDFENERLYPPSEEQLGEIDAITEQITETGRIHEKRQRLFRSFEEWPAMWVSTHSYEGSGGQDWDLVEQEGERKAYDFHFFDDSGDLELSIDEDGKVAFEFYSGASAEGDIDQIQAAVFSEEVGLNVLSESQAKGYLRILKTLRSGEDHEKLIPEIRSVINSIHAGRSATDPDQPDNVTWDTRASIMKISKELVADEPVERHCLRDISLPDSASATNRQVQVQVFETLSDENPSRSLSIDYNYTDLDEDKEIRSGLGVDSNGNSSYRWEVLDRPPETDYSGGGDHRDELADQTEFMLRQMVEAHKAFKVEKSMGLDQATCEQTDEILQVLREAEEIT